MHALPCLLVSMTQPCWYEWHDASTKLHTSSVTAVQAVTGSGMGPCTLLEARHLAIAARWRELLAVARKRFCCCVITGAGDTCRVRMVRDTGGSGPGSSLNLRHLARQPEAAQREALEALTVSELRAVLAEHGAGQQPGTKSVLLRPKAVLVGMLLVNLSSPVPSCASSRLPEPTRHAHSSTGPTQCIQHAASLPASLPWCPALVCHK